MVQLNIRNKLVEVTIAYVSVAPQGTFLVLRHLLDTYGGRAIEHEGDWSRCVLAPRPTAAVPDCQLELTVRGWHGLTEPTALSLTNVDGLVLLVDSADPDTDAQLETLRRIAEHVPAQMPVLVQTNGVRGATDGRSVLRTGLAATGWMVMAVDAVADGGIEAALDCIVDAVLARLTESGERDRAAAVTAAANDPERPLLSALLGVMETAIESQFQQGIGEVVERLHAVEKLDDRVRAIGRDTRTANEQQALAAAAAVALDERLGRIETILHELSETLKQPKRGWFG